MTLQSFFETIRKAYGPLTSKQVEGIELIVRETMDLPLPHQAYILATAWHETARTMQPIAEYGKGKGKPYGKVDKTGKAPYGRGYVQLTWDYNYQKADKKLGLGGQLAKDYDLAMRGDIATKILVRGMLEGWFTTRKLGDYTEQKWPEMRERYRQMRRIVNGMDKASVIADHALVFQNALGLIGDYDPAPAPKPAPVAQEAPTAPPAAPAPVPAPKAESPQAAQPAQQKGLLKAIIDLIIAIFSPKKG